MAISGPMPAGATQQPAGPAIAAYLDDDDDEQWWVFVGANGSSYRSFPAGSYSPGDTQQMLLSPDGSVAVIAALGDPARLDVVDLTSGDVRQPPGLQLAAGDVALALSPDNRRLALRAGSRLAVADVTSGQVISFGVDAERAAFSPNGDRIAVSRTDRVTIVDAATGQVRSTHWVGEHEVAPAGWSPDGSTIALQPPDGAAATHPLAQLDLADGRVTPASTETNGRSAIAWRSNSALVVSAPGGRPNLTTYEVSSGRVALLSENSSDWHPTAHGLRMATALVPAATLVAPGRVDRGHTYSWYAAWLVVGIVMLAVGRWWPRPGSDRRRSDAYLFVVGVLTTPAMAVVVLVPALIVLEAAMGGGKLDAFGLTGFSYLIAACLAVVLLGGAGLLAGLLSRRNPGPVPVAQLPRPLISASG